MQKVGLRFRSTHLSTFRDIDFAVCLAADQHNRRCLLGGDIDPAVVSLLAIRAAEIHEPAALGQFNLEMASGIRCRRLFRGLPLSADEDQSSACLGGIGVVDHLTVDTVPSLDAIRSSLTDGGGTDGLDLAGA